MLPWAIENSRISDNDRLLDYFRGRPNTVGPVITAAGNPDSTSLRIVLSKANALAQSERSKYALNHVHCKNERCHYWDTPLLCAVARQLPENIKILLQAGANSNGIPSEKQDSYSRRFRRFKVRIVRPRDVEIDIPSKNVGFAQTQTFPLMELERKARQSTISNFWADPESISLDMIPNGDKLHSLVMAASTTPEIFQLLLGAGADASFWTGAETPQELPGPDAMTPSALCLSTPLHQAISAGKVDMLSTILNHGINPNARALIAGCQAFTPIQHALISDRLEALRLLYAHPLAQGHLRTPVYNVHVLHLAVAKLRLDLVDELSAFHALSDVRLTALDQNVMHIACMSYKDVDVQLFAPSIRQSIHDVRSLDYKFQPQRAFQRAARLHHLYHVPRALDPGCDGPGDKSSSANTDGAPKFGVPLEQRRFGPADTQWFALPSMEHHEAQLAMMKRLVSELGINMLCRPDYCSNTALHYLASARAVNVELIEWLRSHDAIDRVWKQSVNFWSYTPRDLWVDGVTVMETGPIVVGYPPKPKP